MLIFKHRISNCIRSKSLKSKNYVYSSLLFALKKSKLNIINLEISIMNHLRIYLI